MEKNHTRQSKRKRKIFETRDDLDLDLVTQIMCSRGVL